MNPLRDPAMLILGDLVGFPTVTAETNLDLVEYAANHLEPYASDLRLIHDGAEPKANLLATIGPVIDGGVILSGHTDVVPADEFGWTGAPFVAMRREQRIYGRGTADMKGFIACVMAMAPTFAQMPLALPIHIALTYDEEVGCRGAPDLIADLLSRGPKPSAAIVGEPTGMGIVTAHKGCYEYTTTLTGVEGHGSQPDLGVNAVHHAARFVNRLLELSEEMKARAPTTSPYDPPHTTISAGAIHGGSARNVLAGECVIEWEMRPISRADARFVLAELDSFEDELRAEMGADTSLETAREGEVDGLEDDAQSAALSLVRDLLDTEETNVVPFGTEAGLYQMAGIPAVVCGPGSIKVAHQPDEYIGLDQLEACLDMMERLGEKLSDT
ncbi:MAG TPA: acetylornithine deacetylase [Acidimicrobiia bacterium]|nr:acetylornithine deacetylase [Acidimicrobiia bacterium]